MENKEETKVVVENEVEQIDKNEAISIEEDCEGFDTKEEE